MKGKLEPAVILRITKGEITLRLSNGGTLKTKLSLPNIKPGMYVQVAYNLRKQRVEKLYSADHFTRTPEIVEPPQDPDIDYHELAEYYSADERI